MSGNIAVYRETRNGGIGFDVTKGTGTIAIEGKSKEMRPLIGVDADHRVGLSSTYIPTHDPVRDDYLPPLEVNDPKPRKRERTNGYGRGYYKAIPHVKRKWVIE